MTTPSPTKSCPDCGGTAAEIRLIDKGSPHSRHYPVEYALPEATLSFWSKYPVAGVVTAFMCPQCGRITLYGQPKDEA